MTVTIAPVGINAITNSTHELEVYPNPATDKLTVNSSAAIDNIEAINVLGQTLINSSFVRNKANMQPIDVSSLQAGVYFVEVRSNSKILTRKFVIVR